MLLKRSPRRFQQRLEIARDRSRRNDLQLTRNLLGIPGMPLEVMRITTDAGFPFLGRYRLRCEQVTAFRGRIRHRKDPRMERKVARAHRDDAYFSGVFRATGREQILRVAAQETK